MKRLLDEKYYEDMNSALAILFSLSNLISFDRNNEISKLLDHEVMKRYTFQISLLTLNNEQIGSLSSTLARKYLSEGYPDTVLSDILPKDIIQYIRKNSLYTT